jgi:hypothetical protein
MNDYHYISTLKLRSYIKSLVYKDIDASKILKQAEVDIPRTIVEYNFLHYQTLDDFIVDLGYNSELCKTSTHCIKLPSLKYLLLMLVTQTSLYPVFKLLSDIYTYPDLGLYLSDFADDNKLKIVIVDDDQGVVFTYFKKFRVYNVNQSLTMFTISCKFSFCIPYYYISNDDHCLLEWDVVHVSDNSSNNSSDDYEFA